MHIVVINGIPDDGYDREEKTLELLIKQKEDDEVSYFKLREMKVNYCQGCWGCWVKTPGECVIKDDHEKILRDHVNADLVIYISPVILGYISSLLKCTLDRTIPYVHPYMGIYNSEIHHISRYQHRAKIGLLLLPDIDTTDEDIKLNQHTLERIAISLRADVALNEVIYDEGGMRDVFASNKWFA